MGYETGLERKAFDNKHVTFEEHIRTEHNMWHYLYFIVLIKVKDPTEFTGPESYVHEMVKVKPSRVIPLRAKQVREVLISYLLENSYIMLRLVCILRLLREITLVH